MMTFILTLKRMWRSQNDIDFFQAQTKGSAHAHSLNVNPAWKSSGLVEQMEVPLYIFDWRWLAILLALFSSFFIVSFPDYLNRTPVSYIATVLIMAASMLFYFLFDHYRVSINSEKLLIKTPFLMSIKIPKNQIKDVKTIGNVIYKQKHWVNIVLILSIAILCFSILFSLYLRVTLSKLDDAIMSTARTVFLVSLFIIMFYRHSRRSHYPKAIQVDAGNKNITLYPRNEIEFNTLKEDLER